MEEGGTPAHSLSRWLQDDGLATLDTTLVGALDVIAFIDRDLIIRYLNWTTAGLKRENVTGSAALDLVPPACREMVRETYERVLRTGTGAQFDITFDGPSHVLMWDVRVGPIRHDGEIVGLIAVTTDVTEQRRAQADRDRFFALSLDMFVVASPDAKLKRVNPALGSTLGYEPKNLVDSFFIDLVHPEDRQKTEDIFAGGLRGSPIFDFENRYRHANGSYRVFSWRSTVDPVTGDVYAVARDITDQRNAESQLRHAQKMEAVGQLAGGIAHDFNNLLQAILANTELAKHATPKDSRIIEFLSDVESAASRAADLTKQLLAFSRRQPIRPVSVDLNHLTGDLIKMVRRLIPANIAINFIAGANLWSVSVDPTQLEQVVVNLCVNARDAMDKGGRLTLETQNVTMDAHYCETHPWAKPGNYVLLSVTDTGAGMTPEVRERIFEPFFSTKEAHKGTGLGLSTVYGIIKQHQGVLHVYSEPGEGTSFKIYVPADMGQATGTSVPPELPPPRGSETILLAEDEAVVRRVVVQMLQRAGYQTLVASNGTEAIQLLTEYPGPVHLALLDVVMPELGGLDTWEQLSVLRPELRVLFASGYSDARHANRVPAGAAVLAKPFRMQELLLQVRKVLDERS